jgi:hypothetical protein
MNIFESDSAATVFTAVLTITLTILYDLLSKVFTMRSNRNAKNLHEILDLDAKLEHKNSRVREMVELHEARFTIQQETIDAHKKNKYIMTFAPARGFLFFGLKIALVLGKAIFLFITCILFTMFGDLLIQSGLSFPLAAIVTATIFAVAITLAIRSGRNVTLQRKKYKIELRRSSSATPDYPEFKVKIPEESLGIDHYDFIGMPNYSNVDQVKIYKLVVPNNSTTASVIYHYAYTRNMTILEREWATKLNKLGGSLRKSTFYIPFMKATTTNGVTYSAYYLPEK